MSRIRLDTHPLQHLKLNFVWSFFNTRNPVHIFQHIFRHYLLFVLFGWNYTEREFISQLLLKQNVYKQPGMQHLFSYRWRNYGWDNTILAHSTLFSRIFFNHQMVGLNKSLISFGLISFFFWPSPLISPVGFFGPFHNYKPSI